MQSSRLEPLRDFTVYAVVFAGGFFGTAVRIFSDSIFSDVAVCSHLISADNAFNLGIFAANIVASSLVAFLSAYIPKRFCAAVLWVFAAVFLRYPRLSPTL